MTYGQFLIAFLVVPLALVAWALRRRLTWRHAQILGGLSLVALVYTTPWDNYLVATRVWWYDPARVLGLRMGWVPLEEYLFFVLQPWLVGLWTIAVEPLHHVRKETARYDLAKNLRWGACGVVGLAWLAAVAMLMVGWRPGVYLGLELAWFLPPILLQLAFGADILWARRRWVAWGLLPALVYLCVTDGLAIASGVWTINPAFSTGRLIGPLPLEELVFFGLTSILIVFSVALLTAEASRRRTGEIAARLRWERLKI